jgi:hypothetical protein
MLRNIKNKIIIKKGDFKNGYERKFKKSIKLFERY